MSSRTAIAERRVKNGVECFRVGIFPAKVLNIVGLTIAAIAGLVFSPMFRVDYYWGSFGVAAVVIIGEATVLVILSLTNFTSVDIEQGRVILRSLLWRIIVHASDVERVEMNPPVNTLSLEWSWWKDSSRCVIHRKSRHPTPSQPPLIIRNRPGETPIDISGMPDGLKRRIAQTLDPANWPPLPEEK